MLQIDTADFGISQIISTQLCCRLQAHLLVNHRVRGHGLRGHLPLQQHHRLHERDGCDHGGHDDRAAVGGLLPLSSGLQY